jgi:hypothetical protein
MVGQLPFGACERQEYPLGMAENGARGEIIQYSSGKFREKIDIESSSPVQP